MGSNGDGVNCGDDKLLYLGAQDQYYTFTMFDTQALWTLKYILGDITLPDKAAMIEDQKKWFARFKALKDGMENITFQGDMIRDWCKEGEYGHDTDIDAILHNWIHDKHNDIMTYRDQSYASKYTGTQSPIHHSTFMDALDDSLETFMAAGKPQ
jgi:trimethylamine monooxygenase